MFHTKLGLSALTLEASAWAGIALGWTDDGALLTYLLAHAAASAMLSMFALPLIPSHLTQRRVPTILLMFGASYAIPILGFVGVLTGTMLLRVLPAYRRKTAFHAVELPALDPHQRTGTGFRQAGLRSFLGNTKAPISTRMRALVALQNVSGRVAVPLLRDVLADPSDDIRLLAYGMLDSQERQLNRGIHREAERFAQSPEGSAERDQATRRLSDLYWELVYQELAQGDLRTHALDQSLHYTQLALARHPNDAALLLRYGRLTQELGNPYKARLIYHQALSHGLPKTRVIPYLAETAYALGDYEAVRAFMSELGDWQSLPRLRPVIDYWCRT